jgi:hypothetical protein
MNRPEINPILPEVPGVCPKCGYPGKHEMRGPFWNRSHFIPYWDGQRDSKPPWAEHGPEYVNNLYEDWLLYKCNLCHGFTRVETLRKLYLEVDFE